MEKKQRIRKNSEFRYIYRRGRSYSNEKVVLYLFRNRKDYNRIGISVSKKVGNSVTRNRIKRLIRESYRVNSDLFIKGYDLIFIARNGIKKANYYEVQNAVFNVIRKGGLYKENECSK